jgi:DNA-binding Xre family transcriptional regulator
MEKKSNKSERGHLVLRSNLNIIVANREQVEQRRITNRQISDETGLSEPTIRKYRVPQALVRVDATAITALCEWANVELGEMLYLEYEQ